MELRGIPATPEPQIDFDGVRAQLHRLIDGVRLIRHMADHIEKAIIARAR